MRSILVIIFIAFVSLNTVEAQLFPSLQGEALQAALVDEFKPTVILSSAGSKDSLYAVVENINGTVECVYTGYTVSLTPNTDPSQDVFAQNINQEHVFPRSQGVDNTPAEYDMHHLFPSRVDVNGDRGSLPFGEVPDNQANKWFINASTSGSVPSSNIDGYSELWENNAFEPRESKKGDIARAMFYVYTMYENFIDTDYFMSQVETLCEWHHMDPVDEKEYNRSQLVGSFQSGKANPFTLDCTLAERLFCEAPSEPCNDFSTSTDEKFGTEDLNLTIFNSGSQNPVVQLNTNQPAQLQIRLINQLGYTIQEWDVQSKDQTPHTFQLNKTGLQKGLFFIQINNITNHYTMVEKVLIP